MHLTASCHTEGFGAVSLINVQRNILESFLEQTVTQGAGGQELALLARKWAVVDREGHLNGRCRNLNKFQRLYCLRCTDGLTDGQIFDTGDADDVAHRCGLCLYSLQAFDLIKGDNLCTVGNAWIVEITNDDLVVDVDGTAGDSADTDSADKVVVVDGGNQHLCRCIRFTLRSRNLFEDGVKQQIQIFAHLARLQRSGALFARAVEDLAFQLLLVCVQIEQQVIDLLGDLFVSCVRAVGLVDYDDDLVSERQCLGQNKAGLWHWTLKGVYQQDNAVHHLQDTLNLASEVRVSRGVDDVDFGAFIVDCRIFREDGDASFTLEVSVVHNTVLYRLVVTEGTALLEHLVNQSGLSMVNVRDDGDISQIGSNHVNFSFFKFPFAGVLPCGVFRWNIPF